MPSTNPKVQGYISPAVFAQLEAWRTEQGLSMSQALNLILTEYFEVGSELDESAPEVDSLLEMKVDTIAYELTQLQAKVARLEAAQVHQETVTPSSALNLEIGQYVTLHPHYRNSRVGIDKCNSIRDKLGCIEWKGNTYYQVRICGYGGIRHEMYEDELIPVVPTVEQLRKLGEITTDTPTDTPEEITTEEITSNTPEEITIETVDQPEVETEATQDNIKDEPLNNIPASDTPNPLPDDRQTEYNPGDILYVAKDGETITFEVAKVGNKYLKGWNTATDEQININRSDIIGVQCRIPLDYESESLEDTPSDTPNPISHETAPYALAKVFCANGQRGYVQVWTGRKFESYTHNDTKTYPTLKGAKTAFARLSDAILRIAKEDKAFIKPISLDWLLNFKPSVEIQLSEEALQQVIV